MSIVPADSTPFLPPLPNVSTRIIYDRWLDTDGNAIAPPTVEVVGGPISVPTYKATVWSAPAKLATQWVAPTVDNVGVWFAEVLVSDDPDYVGETAIKISSPRLKGGYIIIQVPSGTTPLYVGDAIVVSLPPSVSYVTIDGPPGESAYQIAVRNGYLGTEQQWLASLGSGGGTGGGEPVIFAGNTTQYWRGDKTWQTLNKTAVGLNNVDNTSDLNKPVSSATTSALNLKADKANPTFSGTVTVPDGSFTVAKTAGLASTLASKADLDPTTGKVVASQLPASTGSTSTFTLSTSYRPSIPYSRTTRTLDDGSAVPSGANVFIIGGTTKPSWSIAGDIQLMTA